VVHKEIANSDPSEFCIPDSLMLNITLDTVKSESVMGELKLSGKISFNEGQCRKGLSAVSGHVGDVKVSLGDFVQRVNFLQRSGAQPWPIILTNINPRNRRLTSPKKICEGRCRYAQ
jgi:hypothetical protein